MVLFPKTYTLKTFFKCVFKLKCNGQKRHKRFTFLVETVSSKNHLGGIHTERVFAFKSTGMFFFKSTAQNARVLRRVFEMEITEK